MGTLSVLMLIVCCNVQFVSSIKIHPRYDEPPVCTSRFDFEEKLLEKMVKISHKFDMLTQDVDKEFEKQDTRLSDLEAKMKERTPFMACPDHWTVFNGSCYLFDPTNKLTFLEAHQFCSRHGAYLVSVDSAEENAFLKNHIRPYKESMWLDLTDQENEGQWVHYGTKTDPSFTDWHPGQPTNGGSTGNEDCAHLYVPMNLAWNDAHCNNKYGHICETRL